MTTIPRRAGALVVAAGLALTGCASVRYGRMAPPDGNHALGLEFGADRAVASRALREAGIPSREAPGDDDAIVADRCPGAPVKAPCRLLFGGQGLYAAQVEVPAGEARALSSSVEQGLGAPDRVPPPDASAGEALSTLVAGWDRPGWTVSVSTSAAASKPTLAVLRVEYDAAAPPIVDGVPLGRLREDVEHALERQGAAVVQRDATATTYLGCPQGAAAAVSCVIVFRGGRAASVTEVQPAPSDDDAALAAWRIIVKRFERDIGRAPETVCPDGGPDRVAGDCTSAWMSDRLTVVVGAHRNAGSRHRGAISVYTAFTYPPLVAKSGEEEAETP